MLSVGTGFLTILKAATIHVNRPSVWAMTLSSLYVLRRNGGVFARFIEEYFSAPRVVRVYWDDCVLVNLTAYLLFYYL